MCDGYQLPKIVLDGAKEVYKMVYDETIARKITREYHGSFYLYWLQKGQCCSFIQEIWALTNVPRKEIGKVFKIMDKIIREKNAANPNAAYYGQDSIQTTQTSAEDLIRRFCSHLGVNTQLQMVRNT